MGVFIKHSKNSAGYRPVWYIKYRDGKGQLKEKPTAIPIQGVPPKSLSMKEQGSILYEKSKTKAEEFLSQFLADMRIKGSAEELTKTLIEEKTGQKIVYVRIDELYDRWLQFSRVRDVTEDRKTISRAIFSKFAAFLKANQETQKWEYLYEVTPAVAKEFIDSLKSSLAASTVGDYRTLLSGAFRRLLPNGLQNPFLDIKVGDGTADSRKIHRIPLNDEQLEKLYKTAKASPEEWLYPVTVCAAETGLRIGDVCELKWEEVFLPDGRLTVDTSKTGIMVNVPIFPEVGKILKERFDAREEGEKYVFPDAASMHIHNKSGIKHRGKRLFATALFANEKPEPEPLPEKQPTEGEILAAIDACPNFFPKKKEKVKDVFLRYAHGQSYTVIANATGYSRGQINGYLADAEKCSGAKILPGVKTSGINALIKKTRKNHKNGKNAVSVYGWHSLRATFCVKAYLRGVPEELIIAVVGHKTFETTKNFYLNPTWEMFRKAWEGKSLVKAEAKPDVQQIVSSLSKEQKSALFEELKLALAS